YLPLLKTFPFLKTHLQYLLLSFLNLPNLSILSSFSCSISALPLYFISFIYKPPLSLLFPILFNNSYFIFFIYIFYDFYIITIYIKFREKCIRCIITVHFS